MIDNEIIVQEYLNNTYTYKELLSYLESKYLLKEGTLNINKIASCLREENLQIEKANKVREHKKLVKRLGLKKRDTNVLEQKSTENEVKRIQEACTILDKMIPFYLAGRYTYEEISILFGYRTRFDEVAFRKYGFIDRFYDPQISKQIHDHALYIQSIGTCKNKIVLKDPRLIGLCTETKLYITNQEERSLWILWAYLQSYGDIMHINELLEASYNFNFLMTQLEIVKKCDFLKEEVLQKLEHFTNIESIFYGNIGEKIKLIKSLVQSLISCDYSIDKVSALLQYSQSVLIRILSEPYVKSYLDPNQYSKVESALQNSIEHIKEKEDPENTLLKIRRSVYTR